MHKQYMSRRALLTLALFTITKPAFARGGRGGGRSSGSGRSSGRGGGGVGGFIFLLIIGTGVAIYFFSGRSKARDSRGREAAQALLTPKPPASDWVQLGLCPLYGSGVVQRTTRKGRYAGKTFFGCSRYPRCSGIRKTIPTPTA